MQGKIFVYDTETNGIPIWNEPSDGDNQPHLVAIAAGVFDVTTGVIPRLEGEPFERIIKPAGWDIPQDTIDVHGITKERAEEEGINEVQAVEEFLELWAGQHRVAHNERFDARIIRIATKRYLSDEIINQWHEHKDKDCTGLLAKPIMKMEPKNRYGYKMPKLTEAYKHFPGEGHDLAHDAWGDVVACATVYFHLYKLWEQEEKGAA